MPLLHRPLRFMLVYLLLGLGWLLYRTLPILLAAGG